MALAMNSLVRLRCRHCLRVFIPDYRNVKRQHYCSEAECRRASKRASQRRWLRKPENRNYFRDEQNVSNVREWRQTHPGYWRGVRHHCNMTAAAESLGSSGHDNALTPPEPGTLKDFCRSKTSVLTGLISLLRRCALQEDMVRCARQVVEEAQCILVRCRIEIPAPGRDQGAVNYHESS